MARSTLIKPLTALFVVVAALAGCSQQGAAPTTATAPTAQAAADTAAAQDELKLYRQMLAMHNDALAAPLGEEIVRKYPASATATEVRQTLAQVQASATAKLVHDRLANLWWYQTADVQGRQSTASIYSSSPAGAARVRLVLRRHAKWGESAYLFAPEGSHGFICKGYCRLTLRFDGQRENWKAYLPKTGEPAMFIDNERRFIAALSKASRIEFDVNTPDRGPQTLTFEVGGYDSARFLPLPK